MSDFLRLLRRDPLPGELVMPYYRDGNKYQFMQRPFVVSSVDDTTVWEPADENGSSHGHTKSWFWFDLLRGVDE